MGGWRLFRSLLGARGGSELGVLVLTLDALVAGKRERDIRHGFVHQIQMSEPVIR